MVTFTLPAELRALARTYPKVMYGLIFECAVSTLKGFGRNKKGLEADLAMTAVLHTHTRRLDYHPHVHIILPGGGVNLKARQWRPLKGRYLFNGRQLAKVFRARLLKAIAQSDLLAPVTPRRWVAQCKAVGSGLPALQYLSRYLYRGVISNRNIISDDGNQVTFRYKDSESGKLKTRSLSGEDFIALLLQHTLPKGFRRSRDYGFLHGNSKSLLALIHWVLRFSAPEFIRVKRPCFTCPKCQGDMAIMGFIKGRPQPG
jgi:hypothetical protein